ncbi:hypothetical protein [Achromobacter piechaudii]|uniref:hypothetical protein n=1 Tax=Achromobacter piechaudii TaxID=72556 RepID=UPI003DA876B9
MSFSISLGEDVLMEFNEPVLRGEIKIDGYVENFFVPTEYWSRKEYLNSWKNSLRQGLREGSHAVLLTSMRDPQVSDFIFYWVIFIEGDQAYIQNRIFFLEEISQPFDPEKINSYVSGRAEFNEDGIEISQWTVGVASIVDFLKEL